MQGQRANSRLLRLRAVVAACALALVATLALPTIPAGAAEATAEIGALTLSYDDGEWAVEDDTIRCISDSCHGAIVDVSVVEESEFCTRDFGYAETPRSFRGAERIAVNAHAIGNLSLVFGQAGPPFSDEVGRAVYACVSRDGLRHEFRSRTGDAPVPAFQDGAVYQLLSDGLWAAPRGERALRLAGAEFVYDGDVFEVVSAAESVDGSRALLTCLPPFCAEPAQLFVSAQASDGEGCFGGIIEDQFGYVDRDVTEVEGRNGATILLQNIPSMCRAMSPPALTACVERDGTRYVVGTLVDPGCYFGPYVPEERFIAFIQGIGFAE